MLYHTLAKALTAQARADLARARADDAARPIGTEALRLGITDYRRLPDPDINSRDWAVWRVRWDGSEWQRVKRYTARQTFEQALDSVGRLQDDLHLPRID